MKDRNLLVGVLAITAVVSVSTPAVAAVDTFLKLDGIKGESLDDKHKDEIDVLSWSWGSNGAGMDAKGKLLPACSSTLTITKLVDKASPKLFQTALTGNTISSATLTARRTSQAGAAPQEYLFVDLTNVLVTTVSDGGGGGGGGASESLSLSFTGATIRYLPMKPD